MKLTRFFTAASLLIAQSLSVLPAHAALFPDVPDSHAFNDAIEGLSSLGVVKGNPDGNFYPAKKVNRAEFLTMLYRAKNLNPSSPSSKCFPDVETSAWFAAVVCDAAKKGHIGGYPDGNFRAEKEVNRVEALKMIFKVFGLKESSSGSVPPYADIQKSAWYYAFLTSSWRLGIVPIAGQEGDLFHPDWSLLRGEAAAYIWNALHPAGAASSSASSAAAARSSASTQEGGPSATDVDFPFGDSGTFKNKEAKVYRFPLKKSVTALFEVSAAAGNDAPICRLYKLNENGFSLEYYSGYKIGKTCTIKVTLSPGNYQMEVTPRTANEAFTLFSKETTGDGNDGFSQAKLIKSGTPQSTQLAVDDGADWYRFSLEAGKNMTVELTNSTQVKCIIFPMEDVDLFGFNGPACNEQYLFPKGTYYVGILREDGNDNEAAYSVRLK